MRVCRSVSGGIVVDLFFAISTVQEASEGGLLLLDVELVVVAGL